MKNNDRLNNVTGYQRWYSKLIQQSVSAFILTVLLMTGFNSQAQDPAQYGTPFGGVPDPQDAVIYQVNMRCFSSSRNLQGVINRLDNIKALGVNVIQLMPVQPVSAASQAVNSPYAWKDFTSVGTEYGSLSNLRTLVDGAHSRGIAVVMDWVANQTGWDHPWISQHPDWYVQVNGQIQTLNGWTDVAALNMANTSMRAAQITAMRYWVFTANIDGFRCDYANNYVSYWNPVISNLRGIGSHKLLMIAEGDGSGLYGQGFDMTFSWNFYNNLKSIQGGSSATLIDDSNSFDYNGASGSQQVVRWLTNHDIYGSEGSPFNIFGGKTSVMGKFVISAYMKSVPFIYNGEEVGNTVAMPFPFTGGTVNWSQDGSVTTEMTKIIAHRNYSNAVRRGTLTTYNTSNVSVFKKVSGAETVFVMVNLRNSGQTINLPSGIANTTMYDAYTNAAVGLTSDYYLSAYQYVVLKIEGGCTSTAIVPYTQVNGGAWNQVSTATLNAGGSVKFGPQPGSGGSWKWTGSNSYSSTSREITIDNVQTNQAGNYVATYTNTSGCTSTQTFTITVNGSSCTPTAIIPYTQVNGGAWNQVLTATLSAGGSVTFGPQPVSGGSWKWTGPNGYSSTSRQITFTNMQPTQSGNYLAAYTNSAGCTSSMSFAIGVNGASCTQTVIVPYAQVNGGTWNQVTTVTLNSGGSVTFGPQPVSGGSWKWSGQNDYTSTNRQISLSNLQANQTGFYVASYTNSSGCISTMIFNLIVNSSGARLSEFSAATSLSDLSIYPNPTQGDANISLNTTANEKIIFSLIDASGRVHFVENHVSLEGGQYDHHLSLSGLKSGLYIIKIENTQGVMYHRVLKH